MSALSLLAALARLAAAVAEWLRDRRLFAAGEAKGRARGRAESDAAHARKAAEQGARMREIAGRPVTRTELEKRLEDGTA